MIAVSIPGQQSILTDAKYFFPASLVVIGCGAAVCAQMNAEVRLKIFKLITGVGLLLGSAASIHYGDRSSICILGASDVIFGGCLIANPSSEEKNMGKFFAATGLLMYLYLLKDVR